MTIGTVHVYGGTGPVNLNTTSGNVGGQYATMSGQAGADVDVVVIGGSERLRETAKLHVTAIQYSEPRNSTARYFHEDCNICSEVRQHTGTKTVTPVRDIVDIFFIYLDHTQGRSDYVSKGHFW